jgi:hypothetical protein
MALERVILMVLLSNGNGVVSVLHGDANCFPELRRVVSSVYLTQLGGFAGGISQLPCI